MAEKGNSQRKRAHKVSKGIHGGGGKTHLTVLEKVLLGRGRLASFRPVERRKSND